MLQILPKMQEGYQVAIDGYLVPRVRVSKTADTDTTGLWDVSLDERYCVLESKEEMNKWVWLLANAQAISEDWSCHGKNSTPLGNPHQVNVAALAAFSTVFPNPETGLQNNPED